MILSEKSGKIIYMKKLVLIDGNSLLNRAFYATPVFTTQSGAPTNGIFGFVKLLFKILADVKPEYLIVAFDLKAPTFRHKLFADYKGTRKPMPDDLAAQVEPLKNLLKAMNIAMCSKEGLEADDIIGTLSHRFDVHSYIYTGDRDSFQLVDEKTDVFYTKRGVSDLLKLSIDNFEAEVGLKPAQIIDLKALMGDKSDNIPGVPGIGEKTARDMLVQYGTLDNIYASVENLKNSVRQKLQDNRELAYLSYELATINRNCDVEISIEACSAPVRYGDDVKKMFEEFEFKSLLALDIFETQTKSETLNEIIYPEKITCTSFDAFKSILGESREIAAVVGDSYADIYVGGKEISLKLSQNLISDACINYSDYVSVLKEIFSKAENRVITYGCKNVMHVLKNFDVPFCCEFDDVSLMKYLVDFNTAASNLKELCEYYRFDFNFAAFSVFNLYTKYLTALESEEMLKLYEDIEKPLVSVLFEMEDEGVKVSVQRLEELAERYKIYVEDCKNKIYELCGCEFNVNSPSQLGQVLHERLGIKAVKKRTGKYSTNAEVLEKLRGDYPVIDHILKFRMYQKLYSTYLDGFRPLIDKKSVVHTTYNQTITSTGRLSSTNPNLQNIPIREEEGRELRKIFVPREGHVFIDADYSQIELRLLAHFSQCKELTEAYSKGVDIHSVTASQVFGVPIEEVTPKMRRDAKAVNFGIIYGISDFGLSRNLDIPVSVARDYIEKYFSSYSAVKDYMNANVEYAKMHGYVRTLTGRKRNIPEIKSSNYNLRQFGERAAMNMPLQGSSADIIKIAMINVCRALKENNLKSKLILQVHDELVLDAPVEETEKASEILKYEMENAVKLSVPLTVDVHSGKDWYEAK